MLGGKKTSQGVRGPLLGGGFRAERGERKGPLQGQGGKETRADIVQVWARGGTCKGQPRRVRGAMAEGVLHGWKRQGGGKPSGFLSSSLGEATFWGTGWGQNQGFCSPENEALYCRGALLINDASGNLGGRNYLRIDSLLARQSLEVLL